MGDNWETFQGEHTIKAFVFNYYKCLESTSNPTPFPSIRLHHTHAFANVGEYVWTICALFLNILATPFDKTIKVFCFLHQHVEVDLPFFIDDFHREMEVTLNREAFIYVLAYLPCLSSGGISPIVYEFWQDCFVPNDFANGFNLFFEVCGHIVCSIMFHFSIAFVFYILISSLEKLSQAQKQPQLQDFLTKMKTKANIVPNLNHKTRKIRKKTQQAQTRIQQDFICKKETKQGYNKKMHLKLVLNKLKVMGNSNSIYTHWEPISKKFFKFFLIYMWPMFTHVHSCVNYEWNKIQLIMN